MKYIWHKLTSLALSVGEQGTENTIFLDADQSIKKINDNVLTAWNLSYSYFPYWHVDTLPLSPLMENLTFYENISSKLTNL